jgi:hypothetical protein
MSFLEVCCSINTPITLLSRAPHIIAVNDVLTLCRSVKRWFRSTWTSFTKVTVARLAANVCVVAVAASTTEATLLALRTSIVTNSTLID